jgi:hypothetical protein
MGIKELPSEDVVLSAMRDKIKEPGLYHFPRMDNRKSPSEADTKAWEEKVKHGPTGILVIHPEGGEAMSPRQLVTELVSNIVAALIAAIILSQVRAGYAARVLIVALMGLFGIVSLLVSYWNWYGFPTEYVAGETITEVVGWLLAGLVLAAIVRPIPAKSSVPE